MKRVIVLALVAGCIAPAAPPEKVTVESGSAFNTVFTEATGLGPLFNGASCASCHPNGRSVGPYPLQFFVTDGACGPAPGGPIYQEFATPLLVAATGQERETVKIEQNQGYRRPPDLFGMAYIEGVSDAEILARADPNDADSDGISGRAHILADGSVGRFGAKAAVSTLREMVALAFREELGITNPLAPNERGLYDLPPPPGTDPTADPELSQVDLDATVAEILGFTLPSKVEIGEGGGGGGGDPGGALFASVGCVKCHVPPVYSDLLLHDMGGALQPNTDPCFGGAPANEIRTAPLIGIRFMGANYMHAGNAQTLHDAIAGFHGGEGAAARIAYLTLPAVQRNKLLAFVGGL